MTDKTNTARRVVSVDPRKLTPYEKNARKHSKEQIASLAQSIERFGWTKPILIDENDMILAGHGAREAAMICVGVSQVELSASRLSAST